jgi:hypothetical protein
MKKLSALVAVCALALLPSMASAQRFGAQVAWGSDSDIGVGARYEHPLTGVFSKTAPMSNAFFMGQFDWFLDACDGFDCTYFEITPAIAVPIQATTLRPYLGAGLNIARISVDAGSFGNQSDSEIGLALLGGLKLKLGGMDAFTDARFTIGGSEQLVLSFGLLFGGR